MKYIAIVFILLMSFLFVACSDNEGDRIFDEIVGRLGESRADSTTTPSNATENESDDGTITDRPSTESALYGTLTILTGPWENHLQTIARYFREIHPNVQIEFERLDGRITDISQQIALATRLLTNPPDIFNTAGLVFEKFNMDALFIDMNELMDGPSGIDRADYFDNILRGAEIDGRLYHVPMMIDVDTIKPNKRLFESIGVTTADMRTITFDEYLDFYLRAVGANPDEEILVDSSFNVTTIFRFENVYDLESGEVNVDTPTMRELVSLANNIPVGPLVEYTPEMVREWISGHFGATQFVMMEVFFFPTINYMYNNSTSLLFPHVFFLQEHSDMQFGAPIHRITNDGEVRFRSSVSPAIMRDSPNQELAWEFIRFAMEFPYTLQRPGGRCAYNHSFQFPVNKLMFDSHLEFALNASYDILIRQGLIESIGDDEEDEAVLEAQAAEREQRIDYALFRYYELIEMLTAESRYCQATINSIVWSDLFLFVTDRQDVSTTLRNIQNRLEIYIAE